MSRLKTLGSALMILGGFGTVAHAQGGVPGGWGPQVNFQSFGNANFGGAAFTFGTPGVGGQGFGMPGFGASYGVTPFGPYNPYAQGFARPSAYPNPFANVSTPQVVNGMDPLMHTIRRSTRQRRTR